MADWEQGGKGAVGGAMQGAAMGSLFGPAGTAIGGVAGGVLGGAMGLFGGRDPYQEQLDAYLQMVGQRQAPQLGNAAQAGQSGFRQNQIELVRMLEAQARGEGPSLADQQARATTDRNVRQQQALAAGARGPMAGAAQFQAMNNAADMGQQATQAAMQGRIAEQFNAQQQLGLTLHSARGADDASARFNAAQQNEFARANLEAKLRMFGINDQATLQALLGRMGQVGPGDQMLAGGAGGLAFLASQMGQQGGGGAPNALGRFQPNAPYGSTTPGQVVSG